MGLTQNKKVQYKIVPEESLFIIGSNSKDEQGDFYTLEINLKLNSPAEQVKKRLLDVFLSLVLLVFSPVLMLFVNKRLKFFRNVVHVLTGRYTWVGYADAENVHLLPRLKNGVVSPVDGYAKKDVNGLTVQKLNFLYAKEYSIEKDLQIILGSLTRLGN